MLYHSPTDSVLCCAVGDNPEDAEMNSGETERSKSETRLINLSASVISFGVHIPSPYVDLITNVRSSLSLHISYLFRSPNCGMICEDQVTHPQTNDRLRLIRLASLNPLRILSSVFLTSSFQSTLSPFLYDPLEDKSSFRSYIPPEPCCAVGTPYPFPG